MRKLKNKAIGIEKRKKAITGKTPVPADHEDPKSPNWKVTSGGNEKVLRCSNTRNHARPKWLTGPTQATPQGFLGCGKALLLSML